MPLKNASIMNILITGAHGFLGSHIKKVWELRNYNVLDLGKSKANSIACDLSCEVPSINEPLEYVIHLAGKAHMIPKTAIEKEAFYNINTKGTQNLLKGLENVSTKPKGILHVSSVAVYGNTTGENISEKSPLNARDPYGESKIKAETLMTEWGKKNNVPVCIIRPPLIIGKNAPGNLEKMIKGIINKRYANIAGGTAKRSMVLAEDIAAFTPELLKHNTVINLTDGYNPSFKELSEVIGNKLAVKVLNIPYPFAKILAFIGDIFSSITKKEMPFSSIKLAKMTSNLTFSSSEAIKLGWQPRAVLNYSKIWI